MAKRIPSHKVEEIYNAADTLEIISGFIPCKKRGTNYFALSPFSNEKTPSFAISPTKNIWKDFSTGKGGNAVTFLIEAEGMSYVEALKYIAEKYNIDLEMEESPEDYIRQDKRESLFILNEFAAKFFHSQLMNEGPGRQIGYSYFKERGILETTMETFQLGYSPQAWDAFGKEALRNQYKEEYIVETGLGFKSDRDGKLLDRFRGRIMFPIHNHLGKVVGFGGRILDNAKKMAKYINSPESDIYQKSYLLYGLHQGKKAIRDLDASILVEGYMDVVALYQAGIENVVASSGTALTVEQIRLLKRFTKNILLIYDADRAGITAALRGVDLLIQQEMSVRVLLLPEGEDPDSYVKAHGKSGFDAYVEKRGQDFIQFKMDHLAMSLDWSDPEQLTVAIHDTASTIARMPDPVKQSIYVSQVAKRFGIGADVMQQSVQQALSEQARMDQRTRRREQAVKERTGTLNFDSQGQGQKQSGTPAAKQESPSKIIIPEQEAELIRLVLNYYDRDLEVEDETYGMMDFLEAEIGEFEFDTPEMEAFRQALFAFYKEKGKIDLNYFLTHPESKIAKMTAQMVEIPEEVSKNWEIKAEIRAPVLDDNLEESVYSAVTHFQFRRVSRMIKETMNQIKTCTDTEKETELMKTYLHLKEIHGSLVSVLGTVVLD